MSALHHRQFLLSVQQYVKDNPESAAYVSEFVANGIDASRRSALERAADMEVALCVAIAARYQSRDEIILSKLEKWNGKAALAWDGAIELLKSKIGARKP